MQIDKYYSGLECMEWCKTQLIGLNYQGLWLIYLATISLFLYFVMLHFQDYFTKQLQPDIYYKLLKALNRLALYLNLGFIIYILYFK